jgi:hypothetical protein
MARDFWSKRLIPNPSEWRKVVFIVNFFSELRRLAPSATR